jgi:flavin-dependent dehydrogenase
MSEPMTTDVLVLGGGLAGLTLALQIHRARPSTRIAVVDKAEWPPPVAAHKVGESTVELGTYYLREVLGLADYLDAQQLPKLGLRFFFDPGQGHDLSHRLEMGASGTLPVPSHQVDRGLFEVELARRAVQAGIEHIPGWRVSGVELDKAGHTTTIKRKGEARAVRSRWVVDATGRAATLKRKLGLLAPIEHHAGAVWFRIGTQIDVDDWSDDPTWSARVPPGMRRLSTNHLMGRGYWVWLIPLVSGSTSIGIVTDDREHDLKAMSTFEGALGWLREHEPQAAAVIEGHADLLQDFIVLRRYSHHAGRMFSSARWALTGDAGAFLDPFYSPGTDFIALANMYACDLIVRELDGEKIRSRANEYSRTFLQMVDAWLPVYQDMYRVFGHTQVLTLKVTWDFCTYWAFQVLTFANRGFVDVPLMTKTRGLWQRITDLNAALQANLLFWSEVEPTPELDGRGGFIDPMSVGFLHDFHVRMVDTLEPDALAQRLADNLARLELISAEISRRAAWRLYGLPLDTELDPYSFSLEALSRGEAPAGDAALGRDAGVVTDLDLCWVAGAESAVLS